MRLHEKLHSVLEQRIGDHISSSIVKRGWNYYTNGNAQNVKATVHDTLTGVVRGSDLYAVVLDAEHFKYSHCTCPYDGFCKHMAAVYFQYAAQHEGGHQYAEQAYFRMLGLTPASALVKAEPTRSEDAVNAHPGEEGTAGQWLAWMEREHGDTWRKCRHSLHALQPVLSSLKGLSRDWDKSAQRLHWTMSILFVLEQGERAIDSVDSFSRYYHEMSFARMAEPWLEHGYTLIAELEPGSMTEGEMDWAEALVSYTKLRAMKVSRQLFEWGFIYLALCEKLSEHPGWHENELSRLQSELARSSDEEPGVRDESFLQAALGMMNFFAGRDLLAVEHFAQTAFERSQRMIYPCAARRMEEANWELVGIWMSFLFEKVHQARNARNIGPFMALCRRADLDRPELPVWLTYMTELLPYSYSELSEHWLGCKRYDDWADLQLFIGIKPEEIEAAELREVAKAAPQTLLPLYHLSIEAAIGSRNRQGYRLAAKQLKKLERLYKASKETAKWEAYITELAAKYQRLRALQEELWKGKIVT